MPFPAPATAILSSMAWIIKKLNVRVDGHPQLEPRIATNVIRS